MGVILAARTGRQPLILLHQKRKGMRKRRCAVAPEVRNIFSRRFAGAALTGRAAETAEQTDP